MSDIHQDGKGKNINVSGHGNTVSGGDMTESNVHITGGQVGAASNHGTQINSFDSTGDADNVNVQGSGNRVAGGDMNMNRIQISGAVTGGNVNIGGAQTTGPHRVTVNVTGNNQTVVGVVKPPFYTIEYIHAKTGAALEEESIRFESFALAYEHAQKYIAENYTNSAGGAIAAIKSIGLAR